MNQICLCNEGIYNTGLPNCVKTQKAVRKSIFVKLMSNAGVLNCIDPSNPLTLAWITALINNPDKSLRYFPTPTMKDVMSERSEPVMEKFSDDSSYFIREGVRNFSGIFADCPPIFKSQLESIRCNDGTGKFDIDLEGNIIGLTNNVDGKLYPIPVSVQSVVAKVVTADDKSTQKVILTYEIPTWVNDGDFRMISGSAFTDFSPLSISGLIDANITFSAIGAGTVTATVTTPSPDLSGPIAIQGLTAANFVSSVGGATSKLRNTTDNADVAITGCVETSPGIYVLTYVLAAAKVVVAFASNYPGVDFAKLKTKNYTTT